MTVGSVAIDRRAMTVMTEAQREACILYYVQGMDQWEIAEMLGITQAAVCHRLTHANRALTENGYPQLARPKVFSCSRRLHQLSERMVKAL